jgi:hypothetical protein
VKLLFLLSEEDKMHNLDLSFNEIKETISYLDKLSFATGIYFCLGLIGEAINKKLNEQELTEFLEDLKHESERIIMEEDKNES